VVEIVPYNRQFKREGFDCGHASLNNYILYNVTKDVKAGACPCFVIVNEDQQVLAYYTLSTESIPKEEAPEDYQRKIKYPYVPVILLGRLAVDKNVRGQGYGKLMLVDALKKSHEVARNKVGAVALIVDPIDEMAIAFYSKYGFALLPSSQRMFMSMDKIEVAFGGCV
jgi:predicted GNAT family N-acyltransferase